MDAPAPVHLIEMYKLIRFVLSTKDYGLKFKLIKSIRKWVLKALSVTVTVQVTRKQGLAYMDMLYISVEYQLLGGAKG